MLRVLALLLVLANGGYWAWTQGALAGLGFAPAAQREPQRLEQQIQPGSIVLLSPEEARKAESAPVALAPPPKPPECLIAGLFDDKQIAALRTSLASAMPQDAWQLESGIEPARWIIYMGKYPGLDVLSRKKAELRQMAVKFEDVTTAALQPGLALGAFATQAEANQELAALTQRGVRTARVVQERAEARGQFLKWPAVDDALRSRLEGLRPQLFGKLPHPCG